MSECVSACPLISVCLCVTVPLSPLLCNCLGLGWQGRPDKQTQIVSGDRLKRSVCSVLYLSSSITGVWQKQRCMMDGCPALSLSTSHSVSLSFTHFSPLGFSSSSHHLLPPSFCNLSLSLMFSLFLLLPLQGTLFTSTDSMCMVKVGCVGACASVLMKVYML